MGERIGLIQSKFEKSSLYGQIKDNMPSLPWPDQGPQPRPSNRKTEVPGSSLPPVHLRGDSSSRARKTKKSLDKNEKIDSAQQPSPKNHAKLNPLIASQPKLDSVDQISRKFDRMLGPDLRVLDQLISSELYPMIERDRPLL